MKRVLIISNHDSVISLFDEYSQTMRELRVVNEKSFSSKTVVESVEKIKSTDFDVLVIGHKIKNIDYGLLYYGHEKAEDGEGLKILELAKNFLKDKIVISDSCTPVSCRKIMDLYRKAGVNHFINRNPVNFTERFNNLILCLNNKCNCTKLY